MSNIKALLKLLAPNMLLRARASYASLKPIAKRQCNICGYQGWFDHFGLPPRLDAECPNCKSLERHRLLNLVMERALLPRNIKADSDVVLHFAPENIFERKFRQHYKNYKTADLFAKADLKLNIEDINLPSESIDVIIANHVLEHVDDGKAATELYRILNFGGMLICMVPIVEGWAKTYEKSGVVTDADRWLHYGQYDHVKFYGHDFRERIGSKGFQKSMEYTAEGQDVIDYGLLRGEKVFVFVK